MTIIYHDKVLETVIEHYKEKHGKPGLEKADVEDLVYKLGGNKDDIYKVMILGMERFFGDVIDAEHFVN